MSEKEGGSSDEGNVPLKEVSERSANKKAVSKKKKKPEKSPKKESTAVEKPEESGSSSKENENDKSKPAKKVNENDKGTPRKRKNYFVEVEEDDNIAVPLLDQPTVVEGSRQRKKVIPDNIKPEVKVGSIPIPKGKGFALGRIPTVSARFKRLRLDEIKTLHRFMFGKLGDLSHLNNNILSFNGFPFANDSTEYARKLVLLGKMNMSILREFLLLFDLDLKIRKKEDVIKAILEFLLCPQRSERTVNPNIVSHPKRRATKRNYYEREIDDEKKPRKAKQSKAKDNETTKETGESSADESAAQGQEETKTKDDESKENNSGADNTNELKKPAKKRKRNQVIEEQTESTGDGASKKSKAKEANNESAMSDELDEEVNTTENLSDDELKNFLKKVLADANLEKTTMKTVYSIISKHYPNYNFSKKKDFIKEVVKSAIQT